MIFLCQTQITVGLRLFLINVIQKIKSSPSPHYDVFSLTKVPKWTVNEMKSINSMRVLTLQGKILLSLHAKLGS